MLWLYVILHINDNCRDPNDVFILRALCQNRAYRPVKMAAIVGHCSMVKHLLQVHHCDLHAKDGVSLIRILDIDEEVHQMIG